MEINLQMRLCIVKPGVDIGYFWEETGWRCMYAHLLPLTGIYKGIFAQVVCVRMAL